MGLKVAVLTNHFSGFDSLRGMDIDKVPVNLLLTNDINSHPGNE